MRPTFVKTQNYQRFMGALEALEARGASECRLVVVDGPPGLGKTTILSRWAADNACVYLRAKVEWSPYWMLGELLKAMRIDPPHGYEKRFGAALQALGERAHGCARHGHWIGGESPLRGELVATVSRRQLHVD